MMTTMGTSYQAKTTRAIAALLAFAFVGAFAPARAAQDCGTDMNKFRTQRDAAMVGINNLVAASKGKQMDAASFCARSQPLNAVENAWIAYMVKNQDWCQIPDDVIKGLKDVHAKNTVFSAKACTVAAQMKKMKEQAAAGGAAGGAPQAQPLPAGPL